MIEDTELVKVQNLTDHVVVYHAYTGQRRGFESQQVLLIPAGELRQLNYTKGGHNLLKDYLAVRNEELAREFDIQEFENEYSWELKDVDELLINGSSDALEDALEFGPTGIVETIVSRAVSLKINDIGKRRIIQNYTGRNIDDMIKQVEQAETALIDSGDGMVHRIGETTTRKRRVKKESAEPAEEKPAKRRVVKAKSTEE